MFGMNRNQITRALLAYLMAFVLALGLVIESRAAENRYTFKGSGISEVSPPKVIQELRQLLEPNQPQVKIISPQPDEVIQDNSVTVKLNVDDLPLFKDTKLGLGPHLQVLIDSQPSQSVYDLNQPLTLQDITPGTHTLQVFAAYPWDESFKNVGAYAQTTFHIFTKSQNNNPNPALPLLTYSRPQGSYGAEPIMLDFYLVNAPLHLVAQERPDDTIVDWQIRCTINGESFFLDRWQPIYLKGFKPGKNWIQLEFLDQTGNVVQNVFNSTIRLITYKPGSQDALSQLVREELKVADAQSIVDPDYTTETVVPTPTSSPSIPSSDLPTDAPSPTVEPSPSTTPSPSPSPAAEEVPSTKLPQNGQDTAPQIDTTAPAEQNQPTESTEAGPPETEQPEKPTGRFLNRFRRPSSSGTPSSPPPTLPEIMVTPVPSEQLTPIPELTPSGEDPLQPDKAQESQPLVTPPERPNAEVELPKPNETRSIEPKQPEKQQLDELDRSSTPSVSPKVELEQDLPPIVTPEQVPQPTTTPNPYRSFKSFWDRYRRQPLAQDSLKQNNLDEPQPSTLEEKTAAE